MNEIKISINALGCTGDSYDSKETGIEKIVDITSIFSTVFRVTSKFLK